MEIIEVEIEDKKHEDKTGLRSLNGENRWLLTSRSRIVPGRGHKNKFVSIKK